MTPAEIKKLLKERDILIKKSKPEGIKRADEIENKIMAVLKKDFLKYEVDFIIETLTMFGQAPNIIYDDNGLFAVSSDGHQPVVSGKSKINGAVTVFVEKKQWKKTIREALKHYLNN